MAIIRFSAVELKSRIKKFILAKMERVMSDGAGFSGIDTVELKSWLVRVYPDVSNAMLLEVYNELKAAGTIEGTL